MLKNQTKKNKDNLKKSTTYILGTLLIITIVVLCLRQIREPDLWWQLRTGVWIIENGEVPQVDVFSYTFAGEPWLNVKWGSEVLQALVAQTFGVSFLPLLQIAFTLATFWFLWAIFKHMQIDNKISPLARLGFIIASIVVLYTIAFRLNTRPEMASHFFAILYVWLFLSYRNGNKKIIFILPLLQCLWANMHEAYGMGLVISIVFLCSFFVEQKLIEKQKKPLEKSFYLLALLIFVSWLFVAIHPSGSRMLFHPIEIFSQLGQNKFTTELYSFKMKDYWSYTAFLNLIIAFFVGRSIFINRKNIAFYQRFGLGYLILLAAFFYLSLSANRNIPFFALLALPLFAVTIQKMLKEKHLVYLPKIVMAVMIFGYFAVVSNAFYNTFLPGEKYGLRINPEKNAVGLCKYIKDQNIEGKAFTDYIISSYMLWELQPNFKTFVDLRDLDIFNAEFLNFALGALADPTFKITATEGIWEYFDNRSKFDFLAISTNPTFKPLLDLLDGSSNFELAYADKISRLYLRRDGANKDILTKNFTPQIDVTTVTQAPENKAATLVSKIFWPPFKS